MFSSAMQIVRSSIHAKTGVMVMSDDERLATVIPNSMAFIGVLAACEDEFGVHLDYGQLTRGTTLGQFVELIERARREDLESGEGAEESSQGSGRASGLVTVPMNPMQVAYLLGSADGIELGGQATFVYLEAVLPASADEALRAVYGVMDHHDVFRARLDEENANVLIDPDMTLRQIPVRSTVQGRGLDDLVTEVRAGLMAEAKASNEGEHLYGAVAIEHEGTTRLCIFLNMVIMDAASMYILLREIGERLAGRAPAPAMSYAQAARRLAERRNPAQRERSLAYWGRKAKELPPAPRFGPDVAVLDDWSTRRCSSVLPREVFERLQDRARNAGVSTSAALLAVHAGVIARWSGQDAFGVNVTVTERADLSGDAEIMGDFTSSMLVGVDTAHAAGIDELSAAVHAETVTGLMNRGCSGVEVLAEFLRGPGSQQEAVMPVVFTSFVEGAIGGDRSSELQVVHTYTQTSQVFLDMQAMPHRDTMSLSWDYVPEYFGFDVQAMFDAVVEAVTDYANGFEVLPVRDLATEALVAAYNNTAADITGGTLMDAVRACFAAYADRPAIISPSLGLTYSYAQVEAVSAQLAGALVAGGCRPGDVVMVESTKHPMSVINQLAVLRAGGVFVPVNAAHPAQRRTNIAQIAGALDLVLTDTSYEDIGAAAYPEEFRDVEVDPGSLAYIIFTSGSTGRPKGVEITHAGAVNTINDINSRFAVNADDVIIGLSALSFDLSIYDIYGALGAGATLAMVNDERDADEIHQVMTQCQVTVWNSTPALVELALLRATAETSHPRLRLLMMSGDRIASDLPDRARAVFPNTDVYSLGGATEGSIWSIIYRLTGDQGQGTIPYGYPLANQQMYVMGSGQRPCPVGVPGEICIGGAGVARGYRSEQDKTDAAFVTTDDYGRIYRTGDLGVFNEHGFIDFLGRRDRQVKIRGHRIELGEIETVLTGSDNAHLVHAAVLDHLGRDTLVAFVVPAGGVEVDPTQYTDLARRYLPDYMVPQYVIGLDTVPVTGHGKVDLTALQRFFDERTAVAPQVSQKNLDPQRAPMRELWEEVLEHPVTSDDASFFELGGDSLRFQELLRRIRQSSGRALRFRDVIAEPTVAHVHDLVEQSVRAEPAVTYSGRADLGGEFDSFPLTDMQLAYLVGRSDAFALGGVTEHYYIEAENDLDIDRFEGAFNALIARHPMLHAVINDDGTQRVMAQVPRYHIEVTDLSGADEQTVERAVISRRALLSHERFAPGTWPQYSLSALDLGEGHYRLFFSVDMVLADGASQRILLADLTRLYEGREPLPLNGRFRDYVMRMQADRGTGCGTLTDREVDEIVADFPVGNVLPELPGARMSGESTVRRLSQLITADEADALRSRAETHGVSITAIFAAAYVNSLSLWAVSDRVGLNVTTYNRDPDIADTRNVIGDFTGVVLLSYDATASRDLFETAATLQRDLLEHLDAGYSGVRMISEISRRKNAIGQAVAPFVLTSLLFDTEQPEAFSRDASVFGRVRYALSQTPQVLLDNQLVPLGGDIAISWDYVEAFFDETMMAELFEHYVTTLHRCAAGDTRILAMPSYSAVMVKQALLTRIVEGADRPETDAQRTGRADDDDAAGDTEVLAVVRKQLRIPDLAASANLFDAGVDSLGFITLVKQVETNACVRVPLASALNNPTAANLARLVRAAAVPRDLDRQAPDTESLVWLAPGGATKALLVHGGFGTVEIYRDLAMAMPQAWDVWGVQFGAAAKPYPQHLSIEEVAARYAEEITARFEPGASIVLVGWSIGGTLGAELAGRLSERHDVTLVMLDSLAPGPQVDVGDFCVDTERALLGEVLPPGSARRLDAASSMEELWLTATELVPGRADEAALVRALAGRISNTLMEDLGAGSGVVTIEQFNTLRTLIAARNTYRPAHTVKRLMALHATDGEAFNYEQWQALAPDGFRTGELEGNHYSILLGADATTTAETIAGFVAAARQPDITHSDKEVQR